MIPMRRIGPLLFVEDWESLCREGEQTWGEGPMLTRRSFLWIEVDGFHVVRNNGVEQLPADGLIKVE